MELIAGFARNPISTAGLTVTTVLVVVSLLVAHKLVRPWVWLEVTVWWHMVAGVALSWQYLARNVESGAAGVTSVLLIALIVPVCLLTCVCWPILWGLSMIWFGHFPDFVSQLRREVFLAVCTGAVVAATATAALRYLDSRSAARQERLDEG